MFSENDMQDLLDAVRQWIIDVEDNYDMHTKAMFLRAIMKEQHI